MTDTIKTIANHVENRRGAITKLVAAGAGAAILATGQQMLASAQATPGASPVASPVANLEPIVVLVHGAFADGASWGGVIAELQSTGIPALATANPLRGIKADATYLDSVLAGIPNPVILVGHSYGGAVITNITATNVIGLVYVAAFVPDENEVALQVLGSHTATELGTALLPASVPASEAEVEVIIDPTKFASIFCADLPATQAAVLAVSQRAVMAAAFSEPSGVPAWKTIPTWYALANQDMALGIDVETFYAERTGGTIVKIDGSHAVAVSQPAAVAEVIKQALVALKP
ncbi:MAG TPA: alpha/beta hydrolase [Thermomicrobiales bacterium]|nr:alpha/beta hydrolase [Thermomicrobiales bacterium]